MDADRRLLLVTGAPEIGSAVTRVTAVLGLAAVVVRDLTEARPAWMASAVVLVGADVLGDDLGDLGGDDEPPPLPRRADVVVVGIDTSSPEVLRRALGVGATRVLTLPDDEGALVDLVADVLERPGPPARVLAVVGGCGGAGTTTIAAGLAASAAQNGRDVLLIDADALGGGVDLVFGAEHVAGIRWPDIAGTTGRINAAAFAESLPSAHGVRLLSWDRGALVDVDRRAADSVLTAATRMCDLVVADLPRHVDALSAALVARADAVLLVVPAEVRAVAAASRVAAALCAGGPTPGVVVRRPAHGRLRDRLVAELLGLPLVGVVPDDHRLGRALEIGEPPGLTGHGGIARLAATVLGSDTMAFVA